MTHQCITQSHKSLVKSSPFMDQTKWVMNVRVELGLVALKKPRLMPIIITLTISFQHSTINYMILAILFRAYFSNIVELKMNFQQINVGISNMSNMSYIRRKNERWKIYKWEDHISKCCISPIVWLFKIWCDNPPNLIITNNKIPNAQKRMLKLTLRITIVCLRLRWIQSL